MISNPILIKNNLQQIKFLRFFIFLKRRRIADIITKQRDFKLDTLPDCFSFLKIINSLFSKFCLHIISPPISVAQVMNLNGNLLCH
jgi:hypothetical protein